MRKYAGEPGVGRSLGVGFAGAAPGGVLGALAASGGSALANKLGKPLKPNTEQLLRSLLTVGGMATGGVVAQKMDGQFDKSQWDEKGKKVPKKKKEDTEMDKEASLKTFALVPSLMKQAGFAESDTGKYVDKNLPEVSVQNGAVTAGAGAGAFGAGKLLSKLAPNKLPNVARNMRRGGVLMAGAGAGIAGIGAVKNLMSEPEKETPKPAPTVPATKDEGSSLMDKVKGSLSDAYDTTKSTVADAYRATKDTASDVLDLPYAKPALAALAATPILYAILKRRKKKKAAPVEE